MPVAPLTTYSPYRTKADSHLVPSPCISICAINPDSQLCEGCLRTLDEIAQWSQMDNPGKTAIWTRIAQRASGATQEKALQDKWEGAAQKEAQNALQKRL